MRTAQGCTLLIGAAVCLTAAMAAGQYPRYGGDYSSRNSSHSHGPDSYSRGPDSSRSHGPDQQGPISREEAESRFQRYVFFLNELDANHNSVLEADEVTGSRRYLADRLLERGGIPANYPVAISRIRDGLQQYYTSQIAGGSAPGTMPFGAAPLGPTPPGSTPGAPPLAGTSTSSSSATPAPSAQPLVLGFGIPSNVPPVPGFGDAFRSGPVALLSPSIRGSSISSGPPRSSDSRSGDPKSSDPRSRDSRSSDSRGSDPKGSEEEAKLTQYAKGLLQQYDKNKSGQLEKDEWSQMKGDVKEADRDNNGVITIEELTAYLIRYSRSRSHGSSSSAVASGGSAAQKSPPYRFRTSLERLPAGLPDWFLQKDADHDGQVSLAEFLSSLTDAKADEFAQYDVNGDGFATPSECLAIEKQKKEKDKGRRGGSRSSATEMASLPKVPAPAPPPVQPGPPVVETRPPIMGFPEPSRMAPPPPPEMRGGDMRGRDMRGGDRPSPEKRFDDMEAALGHNPPKGVLTKEEFVRGIKQSGSKLADKAEETFDRIKKADPNKVTKDEYVRFLGEVFSMSGKKSR